MIRAVFATIAAYLAWSILWFVGGTGLAAAFPGAFEDYQAGDPITSTGYLVCALVLSVVCSFAAGKVCARVAKDKTKGASYATVALLLLTGIGVQAAAWSLMPLWYHLPFLLLLAPVTLAGTRRRT